MAERRKPKRKPNGQYADRCSGNPDGRPRKTKPEKPAVETDSMESALNCITSMEVSIQDGDGSRKVPMRRAWALVAAKEGLKNPRFALRLIELILELERVRSRSEKPISPDQPVTDILDDPLVKRFLDREMRKRLRSQDDTAANALMREQYGPAANDDDPDDQIGGPS